MQSRGAAAQDKLKRWKWGQEESEGTGERSGEGGSARRGGEREGWRKDEKRKFDASISIPHLDSTERDVYRNFADDRY